MKHIVVDLEMNNVRQKSEARRICKMETIEIGAVMLDDDLSEISSFRTYVKPEYNDRIEKKINRLTGISYEMVVIAPVFAEALRLFTSWCLESGDDVTIYAWSENDYSQITKEILLKGYEMDENEKELLLSEWSDFQKEFNYRMGIEKLLSLKAALDMAGIGFVGKEHDALDDARNTAELLHIFKDEKLFELTLKKIQEYIAPKSISYSLGDLFDFSMVDCA